MTFDELTQKLRDMKPVLEQYHVTRLRVFGSVARGESTQTSDVDLIADFSQIPGWKFIGLKEDVEKQLDCSVDLITENSLHPLLKNQILSEARDVL